MSTHDLNAPLTAAFMMNSLTVPSSKLRNDSVWIMAVMWFRLNLHENNSTLATRLGGACACSVGNVKILHEWKKMDSPKAKCLQLLRLVPDGRGVEHRNVVDRDALLDQGLASVIMPLD